ncbi:MAG: hypothetical protein EOO04_10550 [Chitinophagaceae bacterium]|nr:MAG: hypothetical protein EOO04_10550 [Chitinophagaceae bacterium]
MIANSTKPTLSDYLDLYQYLSVLTEEQITKLRRIAVGILPLSAFTSDELQQLANKQKSQLA